MVGALVKQINPAKMLERYPAIAKVAKDNIYTNIPQQHLAAWAELASRMQQGEIRSLPFSNKVVNVGNPDYALIQQMVQEAISGTLRTPTPSASAGVTKAPSTSPGATPTPTTDGIVKVSDAC
ncbi:MAG: LytR family transcriptional regulator, partial [Micrococcales bacterium]|nr:LytR family transcriptional regulator [Micrococcales bacterium]